MESHMKTNCKSCMNGNCNECVDENCLCREGHPKQELVDEATEVMKKLSA